MSALHEPENWDEVRRRRREAERYAAQGDVLAAAMLDHSASAMACRLRSTVCPRCLGIEPGTPAGLLLDGAVPEGPFTPDLCEPCRRVVDESRARENGRW
jgi:hypothetical protein